MKKVLFFTAGAVPTSDELTQIAALNALQVVVTARRKEGGNFGFNGATPRLEPADAVFDNSNVPTEYAAYPKWKEPEAPPAGSAVLTAGDNDLGDIIVTVGGGDNEHYTAIVTVAAGKVTKVALTPVIAP